MPSHHASRAQTPVLKVSSKFKSSSKSSHGGRASAGVAGQGNVYDFFRVVKASSLTSPPKKHAQKRQDESQLQQHHLYPGGQHLQGFQGLSSGLTAPHAKQQAQQEAPASGCTGTASVMTGIGEGGLLSCTLGSPDHAAAAPGQVHWEDDEDYLDDADSCVWSSRSRNSTAAAATRCIAHSGTCCPVASKQAAPGGLHTEGVHAGAQQPPSLNPDNLAEFESAGLESGAAMETGARQVLRSSRLSTFTQHRPSVHAPLRASGFGSLLQLVPRADSSGLPPSGSFHPPKPQHSQTLAPESDIASAAAPPVHDIAKKGAAAEAAAAAAAQAGAANLGSSQQLLASESDIASAAAPPLLGTAKKDAAATAGAAAKATDPISSMRPLEPGPIASLPPGLVYQEPVPDDITLEEGVSLPGLYLIPGYFPKPLPEPHEPEE